MLRKSRRRLFVVLPLLLGCLAITAFFVWLQSESGGQFLANQAVGALEKYFPVRAEIGEIRIKLMSGTVEIRTIRLTDRSDPADKPDIQIKTAILSLSFWNVLSPGFHFDRVMIEGLDLKLSRHPDGGLNIVRMFRRPGAPPGGGVSPVKLRIARIDLTEASVAYEDRDIVFSTGCDRFELNLDLFPQRRSLAGHTRLESFTLTVDGHRIPISSLDTRFELGDNRIALYPAILEHAGLRVKLDGVIEPLNRLQYFFNLDATADLKQFKQPDLGAVIRSGIARISGEVSGEGPDFLLRGKLDAAAIQVDFLPLERIRGTVDVDRYGVRFSDLFFQTLGGGGSAEGTVYWNPLESSQAKVATKGLRLNRLLSLLRVGPVPVAAWNSVVAEVTWPGMDFKRIRGTGQVESHGRLAPVEGTGTAIPFESHCGLDIHDASVGIVRGFLQTETSTGEFSGSLSFDRDFQLDASVDSRDAAELWAAAQLWDLPPQDLLAAHPMVPRGGISAHVRLLMPEREKLSMAAEVMVEEVLYRSVPLGQLSGRMTLENSCFDISEVEIRAGPSLMKGRFRFGLEPFRLTRLEASTRQFPLDKFFELGFVEPLDDLTAAVDGELTGEIVESSDKLEAAGALRFNNGMAFGETVDQFEADFRISGQTIEVVQGSAGVWGGRIDFTGSLDLTSESVEAQAKGKSIELASISAIRLEEAVNGSVDLDLRVSGSFEDPEIALEFQAPEIAWRKETVRDVSVSGNLARGNADFRADLESLGQPFLIKGTAVAAPPYAFEAAFDLPEMLPKALMERFGSELTPELTTRARGKVSATGTFEDLPATLVALDLTEFSLDFKDGRIELAAPLHATLRNRSLELPPSRLVGAGTDFTVAGKLDLQANPHLNAQLKGSLNLDALAPFLGEQSLRGGLLLETNLAGPLDNPRIVGTAQLIEFGLSTPDLKTDLRNGQGSFRFTTNQVSIEQFSVRTDFGVVDLSGGVFLEGLRPTRYQINVSGTGLSIEMPKDVVTTFDADLDLSKGDETQLLSGVVYIRSAEYVKDITVAELARRFSTSDTVSPDSGPGTEIRLDIAVEAYQSLRISNNLAQIIGSSDLSIIGTLADPVILGSLTVDQGLITWDGKEFEISRGAVTFNDPGKTTPYFNFEVETQVREFDVTATVQGPTANLQVALRSEPPLAPTSIMALLASGQTSEEIMGTDPSSRKSSDALMTYGAGALLSKTLGQTVEAQANRLFGFDRFAIDPFLDDSTGKDPGARITLGKQLTRELGVTYVTNLTSDFKAQTIVVEYRVNDWFTVIGTSQSDDTFAVDFRFRKRF